jgi:hypothetical protein
LRPLPGFSDTLLFFGCFPFPPFHFFGALSSFFSPELLSSDLPLSRVDFLVLFLLRRKLFVGVRQGFLPPRFYVRLTLPMLLESLLCGSLLLNLSSYSYFLFSCLRLLFSLLSQTLLGIGLLFSQLLGCVSFGLVFLILLLLSLSRSPLRFFGFPVLFVLHVLIRVTPGSLRGFFCSLLLLFFHVGTFDSLLFYSAGIVLQHGVYFRLSLRPFFVAPPSWLVFLARTVAIARDLPRIVPQRVKYFEK